MQAVLLVQLFYQYIEKIPLPKLFNFRKLDFAQFVLTDDSFAKGLQSFETCVSVNNKSRGKLFSWLELPTIFDERFKVTAVPFLIPKFKLLSFKLGNFTCKVLNWVISYWHYIKVK